MMSGRLASAARSLPTALSAVLLIALVLLLPAIASADTSNSTSSIQATPFAGYWDRFSISHPAYPDYHPRSQCESTSSGWLSTKPNCSGGGVYGPGDWATDYYAAPFTYVKFKHYDNGANYTAKVWNIAPTCSSASAGYTIFIDLWVNGTWEGWVAYGHLTAPQVNPGDTLSQNQVIGVLFKWPESAGCWEVTTNEGVHTHVEMWDAYKYACYVSLSSGSYYPYGYLLGYVGKTVYTGPYQAC